MQRPELAQAPATPAEPGFHSQLVDSSSRLLACALCQRRKLKCTRKFPCSNCIRSNVDCVPGTLAKRKPRFPEKELLQRVRRYEMLLQKNNIKFDPLHRYSGDERASSHPNPAPTSPDEHPELAEAVSSPPLTDVTAEDSQDPKHFWQVINHGFQDSGAESDSSHEGIREPVLKEAVSAVFEGADSPFFAYGMAPIGLPAAHPEPVQIFRLWDTYVANVHPLLKVTHAPTLQGRIIEALGDTRKIDPNLQALMFGIYCTAVASLEPEACQSIFGASKQDLAQRYQPACWQALLDAKFLRTNNQDCLTALYLYLISLVPTTDPSSLSSMLGLAVRIARQMGLHSEERCAKFPTLEAEVRRRLWWSLMLLDFRVAEMACHTPSELLPPWDCRLPLDVNENELRPNMKETPVAQSRCTDAVFLVVLCELAGVVGRSIRPPESQGAATAKDSPNGPAARGASEILALESRIEDKYLRFCDAEIPTHFTTIWMARGYLAKLRLMEHYCEFSPAGKSPTEPQRDRANMLAVAMLDCDTKMLTSPLAKGFLWFIRFHFPFLAYIQLTQDLRCRPYGEHAERAWQAISENYLARRVFQDPEAGHLFQFMAGMVLQAWAPREAGSDNHHGNSAAPPPRIVLHLRQRLGLVAQVDAAGPHDPAAARAMPHGITEPAGSSPATSNARDAFEAMDIQESMVGVTPLSQAGFVGQTTAYWDTMAFPWPPAGWGYPDLRPGFRMDQVNPNGMFPPHPSPGPLPDLTTWQ